MTPKWWAGLLFTSLAVNVLLAGVVVTLVANAPFVRLRGTWTSNASSGTFDLAKR